VQEQLDQILSDTTQLSAPISGENRSAIQMMDLNGDNIDEVLAFCKTQKDEAVVLQIFIFRLERGKYTRFAVLEGVGDTFDACSVPRMGLEKLPVLIVGWRLGANPVCGITAYRMGEKGMEQMYSGEYTGLIVDDFDADHADELLVLRHQADMNVAGNAVLLNFESGRLVAAATAPLSATVTSPLEINYEYIGPSQMGVVVDGLVNEEQIVTDVLCFRGGVLSNLTFDELTQQSQSTLRPAAYLCTDVDSDGILEIPMVSAVPGNSGSREDSLHFTHWYSYNEETGLTRNFSGYWDIAGSWFCVIPDTLISGITVGRGETVGEYRSVEFCQYNGETEGVGAALWERFCLVGEQRYHNLDMMSLAELARTRSSVYAAKVNVDNGQRVITIAEISSLFYLVG